MTFLIIFLVALKTHPIISILILIPLSLFIMVTLIVLPKKVRIFFKLLVPLLFITYFFNLFAGHFVTNSLIDKFGTDAKGMVVSISNTSDLYNDQPVYKYDVMFKTSDNNIYSTYFLTSDFNIVHGDSINEYSYPQSGVNFNVRFINEYPKAFVIIANDDSDYSKVLESIKLSEEIDKLENQLKIDSENTDIKKQLDVLKKKQTDLIKSKS